MHHHHHNYHDYFCQIQNYLQCPPGWILHQIPCWQVLPYKVVITMMILMMILHIGYSYSYTWHYRSSPKSRPKTKSTFSGWIPLMRCLSMNIKDLQTYLWYVLYIFYIFKKDLHSHTHNICSAICIKSLCFNIVSPITIFINIFVTDHLKLIII